VRHVITAAAYYVTDVGTDPVLDALDGLVRALRDNQSRIEATIARAERIREQRDEGLSYREIESGVDRPLIVELTRDNLAALVEAGSRLRRAEARALHAEGMTMEQIAELFGVTRQRVSALLRSDREPS
jgi:DNA-binding CsgD family transcriptional regulator